MNDILLFFVLREYVAEVRVQQREIANREQARNAELQYELRQSVTAMEQMIESQQRIERIQRSLTYLRDLHSRMVSRTIDFSLFNLNSRILFNLN